MTQNRLMLALYVMRSRMTARVPRSSHVLLCRKSSNALAAARVFGNSTRYPPGGYVCTRPLVFRPDLSSPAS